MLLGFFFLEGLQLSVVVFLDLLLNKQLNV